MKTKKQNSRGNVKYYVVLPTLEIMLSASKNCKNKGRLCRHGIFQLYETLQDADRPSYQHLCKMCRSLRYGCAADTSPKGNDRFHDCNHAP